MALVRVSELLITLYDTQDFKMCAPSVVFFFFFCNFALCERPSQSLHTKNKIVRPKINTPKFLLSMVVKKNISSCRIMSYIFFLFIASSWKVWNLHSLQQRKCASVNLLWFSTCIATLYFKMEMPNITQLFVIILGCFDAVMQTAIFDTFQIHNVWLFTLA